MSRAFTLFLYISFIFPLHCENNRGIAQCAILHILGTTVRTVLILIVFTLIVFLLIVLALILIILIVLILIVLAVAVVVLIFVIHFAILLAIRME